MNTRRILVMPLAAVMSVLPQQAGATETAAVSPDSAANAARCAALVQSMAGHWPDASTRLLSTTFNPAGPAPVPPGPPGMTPPPVELPAHCAIIGTMRERTGVGSVAKIVKLEHAWRRLDGRNDDG
ncbi:hypothetical protein, partial [Erythrobacter westpacificensis]|uniref:hypothetical protein n=2 Tax=Erythrobacteraceae TaxID=335929 RepID=UPI003D157D0D